MKNIAFIHQLKADIKPILRAFNASTLFQNFNLRIGPDLFHPVDDDTTLILCAKKVILDEAIPDLNWHPKSTYRGIPVLFLSDEDFYTKELIIRAVDFEIMPNNTLAYKNFFDRLSKEHPSLKKDVANLYGTAS